MEKYKEYSQIIKIVSRSKKRLFKRKKKNGCTEQELIVLAKKIFTKKVKKLDVYYDIYYKNFRDDYLFFEKLLKILLI